MKGIVYKSTGSWYVVKAADGSFWNARLRGSFKIDGLTSTNPVVVGDEVDIEIEDQLQGAAIIFNIFSRRNHVNRQSPQSRMQQHIIAANVDQSLLMASLKNPKISQGFIDRFLVTAQVYHVPAILVLNKSDIYGNKETGIYHRWKAMYESIGNKVILISVATAEGLPDLKPLLNNKVTLVSGPSGVGKSSFINAVFPSKHLKTQEVSNWSGKCLHTTSSSEMYDLPEGGQLIDTPGIREFGLVNISRQELSHYFPEMRDLLQDCQFNDCLHLQEPGCAIKKALEEGKIYGDRYISYRKILETIDDHAHD